MKRIVTFTAIIALIITGCSSDPYAEFRYTPKNPAVGEQVFFENLSLEAEYVEWDFGDGTISSVYNPVHTFTTGGPFLVELRAFGKRDEVDITSATINVIDVDPLASFGLYTYLPGDDGDIPVETDLVFVGEQVEFYNTSEDAASYLWDFGDGISSEVTTPVYSYDYPGTYTVVLKAFNLSGAVSTVTKRLKVVEGINSTVRITVLELLDNDDSYIPVEGASVIIYNSLDDWDNFFNPFPDEEGIYTTELGKCVFEGLYAQRYYVDAYAGDDFNNWSLGADDVEWIETQVLDPGYIHDFFAYIWYSGDGKKSVRVDRVGKKRIPATESQKKQLQKFNADRNTKFSRELKK